MVKLQYSVLEALNICQGSGMLDYYYLGSNNRALVVKSTGTVSMTLTFTSDTLLSQSLHERRLQGARQFFVTSTLFSYTIIIVY